MSEIGGFHESETCGTVFSTPICPLDEAWTGFRKWGECTCAGALVAMSGIAPFRNDKP